MAIHRLLEGQVALRPDQIAMLVAAYDHVCASLHLKQDRYAAANEVVALKVIEIAKGGFTGAADDLAWRVMAEVQIPPK
jgi:hypothetical protein